MGHHNRKGPKKHGGKGLLDRLLGGGHHGSRGNEDGYSTPEPQAPREITVILCPSCHAKNPENAKFCTECGASLSGSRNCGGCGADMPPGSKFCPGCGKAA